MAKTIDQLTPEQLEARRKYDRERAASKREKERLDREKAEPMTYDQACEAYDRRSVDSVQQQMNDTFNDIFDELQLSGASAVFFEALDRVLTLSYCFEHDIVYQTDRGPLYGRFWAEVSGEDIVRWRHQLDLTRSKTFSDIYWPLVRKLDEMYGTNIISKDPCYRSSAQAIKDELAGTYVYPPPQPAPKVVTVPEPEPAPEPDTDLMLKKVLDQKRQQLLEEISRYGQLNPQARSYLLDGYRT